METLEKRALLASFQGIGDLPGGAFNSNAADISPDGGFVVGTGSSSIVTSGDGFRWGQSTGFDRLGALGSGGSTPLGVSANGAVVVGRSYNGSRTQAFRWNATTGQMIGIPFLTTANSTTFASAVGVSDDGTAIAGHNYQIGHKEAFRWTAATGTVGLGYLPNGGYASESTAISADGNVVVGFDFVSPGGNSFEPFRWDASTGMQGLGNLPGVTAVHANGQAMAVSANGSIVVGWSMGSSGQEAFRWTATGGMVGLGDLPGGEFISIASGISADGSVVIGKSWTANGPKPFIWTSAQGIRALEDVLTEQGLGPTLAGWRLSEVTSISADGMTISGNGTNPQGQPEGWVAKLGIVNDLVSLKFSDRGIITDLSEVQLEYRVTGAIEPFTLQVVTSADSAYSASDPVVATFTISPNAIVGSNGDLRLANETPESALEPGTHRLIIRTNGTALARALKDAGWNYVVAVVNPGGQTGEDSSNNESVFAGFYRESLNDLLIVRTGKGLPDQVSITGFGNDIAVTYRNSGEQRSLQASFTSSLAVVTTDGDDTIQVALEVAAAIDIRSGDGDDILQGGGGTNILSGGADDDRYEIYGSGQGSYRLLDAAGDHDEMAFLDTIRGVNVSLGQSNEPQTLFDGGPVLILDGAIDDIWGTAYDDFLVGNDESNYVDGQGGSDVLLGMGGDDLLLGGDGIDAVFGDGINLNMPDARLFLKDLINLKIRLAEIQVIGEGNDVIDGGDGFDILIGGGGNDVISAGLGPASLILGDGFRIVASVGPGIDLAQLNQMRNLGLGWGLLFSLTVNLELTGAGADTITGGSGIDLILTGDGENIVETGGGLIDLVYGGANRDIVDASQSLVSLLIGNKGDDSLSASASPNAIGSILIGDGFEFKDRVSPEFQIDWDVDPQSYLIQSAAFVVRIGLIGKGDGKDTLSAPGGIINLAVGGDGDDTITAGGLVDFVLGDTFNAGAGFAIDLKALFTGSTPAGGKPTLDFQLPGLAGRGADTITTAASGISAIFAGDGKDAISAGDSVLNVVFGNGGDDSIDGRLTQGLNILAGGDGDDTLYGGLSAMNFLMGDGFTLFDAYVILNNGFDLDGLLEGRLITDLGLLASGDGDDVLQGGTLFDILVGGDGNDELSGIGNSPFLGVVFPPDILIGDGFSLGARATVNFLVDGLSLTAAAQIEAILSLVGAGVDHIIGSSSNDLMIGGGGNDLIETFSSTDFLFGNEGDDVLRGGADGDYLFGGSGNDRLEGGFGDDDLDGGQDNDTYIFYGFNLGEDEVIEVATAGATGGGTDTLDFGQATFGVAVDLSMTGWQTIASGQLRLRLTKLLSIENVIGSAYSDTIWGNDLANVLEGGQGSDRLYGRAGNDTLRGQGGNDSLYGDAGADRLEAGDGDDYLDGGLNSDILIGGVGRDRYRREQNAVIYRWEILFWDFKPSEDDEV